MDMLSLNNPESDVWIHPDLDLETALDKTSHLAIGAHQDDLEFMAFEGISTCYGSEDHWFTGITVTDGRGSSRTGPYSNFDDEEMREIRREEQRKAARTGNYAAQFQLDYRSSEVKASGRSKVIEDLVQILTLARPQVIYLHQPADKHDTHIAVMSAGLEAIRQTSHHRPERVIGCEVWRGLDWLDDSEKVAMDCSRHPDLFAKLTAVFDSQITGGKRYDLAVQGRYRANATFFDSHSPDQSSLVAWGMDLTPLVTHPEKSLTQFIETHMNRFQEDVVNRIGKFS